MDRETVRRQIEALLVRRKVYRTKKRRGATAQVKVYRLPKITYESGGKCRSFGNHASGGKARDKRGGSGGKSAPNNDYDITTNTNHDGVATCNSIPCTLDNRNAQSVSSLSLGYQNQPTQTHAKWPEFDAWCRSKGGTPTETGFRKWLRGQRPQWRNKIKKAFDETGYEHNGKFLTSDEANRLGKENPDLLTKFRKAVKRDSKIEIIHS